MYAHRGPPPSGMTPRYLELLEMLRGEYENLHHEVSMGKIHREDAENKFHAQLVDLNVIQKALYELERAHMKMKQHYENEIARLKHELEERGGPSFAPGTSAAALIHFPSPPALEAELASFASTFASLPASTAMEQAGITVGAGEPPISPYGLKRGPEDDLAAAASFASRNVRPRDEMMPPHPSMGGGGGRSSHIPLAMMPSQPSASARAMDGAGPYLHHPHLQHPQQPPQMVAPPQYAYHPHHPPVQSHPPPPPPHPSSASSQPPLPSALSRKQPTSGSGTIASSSSASGSLVPPPETGGFDWLVVYNPKAARSINIDLLHTIAHENVVCCVRFSLDGRYLATGSNRTATIVDVKSGERTASLSDVEGVAQDVDQYVRSVSFSPDGRHLVTGSEDQIVRIWDVASQKLLRRLTGHSQDIYSVEYFPDGKRIASGSGDRTVCIWDSEGGQLLRTLPVDAVESGREAGITSVAVSPNGRYVVAGCLDRTIRVWDADSGKPLDTLEGHRDSVYSVSFAPDGRHLISGSLDRTIKVWQFDSADDIHRGTCKYTILGHKDFVLSVAGTPPDGRWIVSGSKDRSVQFWDSLTGTTQLMLQGHKNSVISVAISPTGSCFATGSGDCRARIWTYTRTAAAAVTQPDSVGSAAAAVGGSAESSSGGDAATASTVRGATGSVDLNGDLGDSSRLSGIAGDRLGQQSNSASKEGGGGGPPSSSSLDSTSVSSDSSPREH